MNFFTRIFFDCTPESGDPTAHKPGRDPRLQSNQANSAPPNRAPMADSWVGSFGGVAKMYEDAKVAARKDYV